ncbi:MAG: DUF917 family protein [Boseongicola sp.]
MFSHRANFSEPLPAAVDRAVVPRERTSTDQPDTSSTVWLTSQAQADILDGAAFLAAGGGGAKSLGRELISVLNGNWVPMVPAINVPDDAYVVCSAYIGSPAAALKLKSPTFNSLMRAIDALETSAGINADYVVPGETGAVNSLAPILSAHDLGRTVVDAGGCGRAVPLIAATTFGVHDALATYGAATANDADNPAAYQTAVLSASTTSGLQGGIGALAGSASYGELCGTALWLMTGAQLKTYAVPSGLSRAQNIGAALRTATGNYTAVVLKQLAAFGMPGRVLFDGSLLNPISFTTHTQDAHDTGTLVLERQDGGGTVTVYSLNENVLAYSSDQNQPVILMPDMICWLGADGSTFDNAQLQAEVSQGKAKPMFAIGVEATQTVGAPSSGVAFRDYPGIGKFMAAIMGAVGYAGAYVPFKAG